MAVDSSKNEALIKELNHIFASYRAEWTGDDIFEHFTKPSYFAALEGRTPCVLQGGRGSGKTTALRGLAYDGQYKFHGSDIARFDAEVQYIGLYHRIDTNHVRAFQGGEVSEAEWGRLFGHYFNLVITQEIVTFLNWHSTLSGKDEALTHEEMSHVLRLLCVEHDECVNYSQMQSIIDDAIYAFQGVINNVSYYASHPIKLSAICSPVKYLIKKISALTPVQNKVFYILLDEYENLEDYQQVIINTLIKHSAGMFVFKIGVRELGWRKKNTSNESEMLTRPADYDLLDINDLFEIHKGFPAFAKDVCQRRFQMLFTNLHLNDDGFDVERMLESLSSEDEAIRLGVEDHELVKQFTKLPGVLAETMASLPPLYKFVMAMWAKQHGKALETEVDKFIRDRSEWDERYGNYKYHMLFKINIGRGSAGVQKYYCGFDTFVKLAHNNIRFLMELVYKTFERHLDKGKDLFEMVSAEVQTETARKIGEKNLAQLESESSNGPKIVNMLVGLGRIFELLAKSEKSTAAETNQIFVKGLELDLDLKQLVCAAVRELALVKCPGDKRSKFQTRSYEYYIHPIFSPFFKYSYRRKRKMNMDVKDLRELVDNPDKSVKYLVSQIEDDTFFDSGDQLTFSFREELK